MERESFVFYASFYQALKELETEDQIIVYDAICRIALYGEQVDLSGVPAAIVTLIKPQIEANNKRYANGIKGAEGGRLGGRPKNPKETPNAGFENPKETPNENVNDNVNVNVNENVNENENENVNAPALQQEAPPAREKYGEYGWVKLTGREYARLENDLGWEELGRCIRYIDELAQSTGNKNKWRDWNLVIRRCHKEGWGKRATEGQGNPFLLLAKERGVVP